MTSTNIQKYEVVIVFQPGLLESAVEKKLKEFEVFLEENEGKVIQKVNGGKKNLSYRIKKFDKGIYANYLLELPTSILKELDQFLRIHPDILRYLITTVPHADYELSNHENSPIAKKTFATKQKHELGKRRCSFCTNQLKDIDFKDVLTLKHFIDGFQKIKNRRYTGVCLQHQKALARSIKRARHLALVPFVN